jgi:hypothetical protein
MLYINCAIVMYLYKYHPVLWYLSLSLSLSIYPLFFVKTRQHSMIISV